MIVLTELPFPVSVNAMYANKARGRVKSIGYAATVFYFALPLLPDTSAIKSRLGLLWDWVQHE